MPRAQDGSIISGMVDPSMVQSTQMQRNASENRINQAMEKSAIADREKTQMIMARQSGDAQRLSTERINDMQIAAADARGAEEIKAHREDREFSEKLQLSNQAFQTKATRLEREYKDAKEVGDWARADKIIAEQRLDWKVSNIFRRKEAADQLTMIRKLMEGVKNEKTVTQKAIDSLDEVGKRTNESREIQTNAVKELQDLFRGRNLFDPVSDVEGLGVRKDGGIESIPIIGDNINLFMTEFDKAANRLGATSVNARVLGDKAELVKRASNGEIDYKDLIKTIVIMDTLKSKAAQETAEAEGKDQEETITIYPDSSPDWLPEWLIKTKEKRIPSSAGLKVKYLDNGIPQLIDWSNTLKSLRNDDTPIKIEGKETGKTVGNLVDDVFLLMNGGTLGAELEARKTISGYGDDTGSLWNSFLVPTEPGIVDPNVYDDPQIRERIIEQNKIIMSGE